MLGEQLVLYDGRVLSWDIASLELEARQPKPHLERERKVTLDLTRQGSIRSGDACETDRVREVREPVQGQHKYISRQGSIRSGDACETDRVREVREPVRGQHKYISRQGSIRSGDACETDRVREVREPVRGQHKYISRQGSIRSGDACETDRVREVREPVRGRHKYISREEDHGCRALVQEGSEASRAPVWHWAVRHEHMHPQSL
ncbi:hypothetical protein BGY98DRAFT_1113679 [Russula aff. rugulosa BPL654]|nr:hypothetical protein BGY98DRAFT_1113679 [Russula aff. rugulosa BPL654]